MVYLVAFACGRVGARRPCCQARVLALPACSSRSGEAYVEVADADQLKRLTELSGKALGARSVRIRACKPGELDWALAGFPHPANGDYAGVVRFRGLPKTVDEVSFRAPRLCAPGSRARAGARSFASQLTPDRPRLHGSAAAGGGPCVR